VPPTKSAREREGSLGSLGPPVASVKAGDPAHGQSVAATGVRCWNKSQALVDGPEPNKRRSNSPSLRALGHIVDAAPAMMGSAFTVVPPSGVGHATGQAAAVGACNGGTGLAGFNRPRLGRAARKADQRRTDIVCRSSSEARDATRMRLSQTATEFQGTVSCLQSSSAKRSRRALLLRESFRCSFQGSRLSPATAAEAISRSINSVPDFAPKPRRRRDTHWSLWLFSKVPGGDVHHAGHDRCLHTMQLGRRHPCYSFETLNRRACDVDCPWCCL